MTEEAIPGRTAKTPHNLHFFLATLGDVIADTIRNYRNNGDTNQAAAIALYAILSIIPLFLLTYLLVGNLFGANPEIQGKLIEGIREFVPSFSGELLTQFGQIERKRTTLGWVGIISLIWFSAMIFNAIETALNIIFRSKSHRNYFASKLLAIAMIPLGWAIGVASVGITYIAAVLAEQPLIGAGGLLFFPVLHNALFRYLLPYLVTVLFFTVVYKVIPTGKVSLKSALVGSAIFSALMEIAKQFFTWYVANYTRYNVIFGSLEAVVILVIWAFYLSLILLFCAELIASYERRDTILLEKALLRPRKDGLPTDVHLFRKFGRLFEKDAYIFREGDVSESIYYILSGRVRMEKSAGKVTKILAEMGPGQYFGEMAALIRSPRTASARCAERCHIAVIESDTLRTVLRDNEEVSLFMLKEFSNRLRRGNEALDRLTQDWIALMATLYFLRAWPLAAGRDPVAELARATGKEAEEIQEVLTELGSQGVLTLQDSRVTAFHPEEALRRIDAQVAVEIA
ncbi:MAG: YihY family inner membrane protein [Deltaproteobacteria bacterium]|nr:YihY family inner membrane protein [Deltaproteobacteria bacterium]